MWDREDYLAEGRKQLNDTNVYEETTFGEKELADLSRRSNDVFKRLKSMKCISEKELKYFLF